MLLLTGSGFGCLAVIFLIIARDFGRMPVAKTCLALLIAAAAFLLNNVIKQEWKWLTYDIMTMLPAIFWLLCQLASLNVYLGSTRTLQFYHTRPTPTFRNE